MCGKFTQRVGWDGAISFEDLATADSASLETITPMRFAGVIHLDGSGNRKNTRMRWGLVPSDAQDPLIGTKFIHARAETVEQKPTFRENFFQRRGILPIHTFNEGEELTPRKTLQYVVTPRDGLPIGIAVIWDVWTAPNGAQLVTYAMVTTPANELIGKITDRMPAVIPSEHWAKWLGEEAATLDELKGLLVPLKGDWDMHPAGKPPPPPPPPPKLKKPDRSPYQPDLF
jgi:putative SOS response-associated peptidase YedK